MERLYQDINHPSLPYLSLSVTMDTKRRKDRSDTANKRERNKKGGHEWMVIRITYAESKAIKLRKDERR